MRFVISKSLGCLAAITLLAPTQSALADLVNGDFNQGLNGWMVTAADNVAISGGVATISQSPDLVQEVDLYQVFTVPNSPETLQFTLAGWTTDSDLVYPTPAAFNASLVDAATLQPLVPTVVAGDSFFTHDLTDGAAGLAASGVGVKPFLTSDAPLTVSVDLSGLTGANNAEILFRLLAGGDNQSATVSISDVKLIAGFDGAGGSSVVPEPGTFCMLLMGMTGLALAKRRHH